MVGFLIKRIFLQALPTLFFVATLTFFLIRCAPGGPFSQEKNIPPEVLANLNAHYGLDKPLLVQYTDYLLNVLRGNLGPSFKYPNRTVNELIASSFPVSLELGAYALIIALILGLSIGCLAALKRNTPIDYTVMSAAMTGICVPSFVLGPLLVLVFGLWLGWSPVSGWHNWSDRILPAITLSAVYIAYIARLCRAGMLDVLSQDFIRTARAKGARPMRVLFVHALRGGIQPAVSFIGPAAAGMITGSFVVETIFQVPGLGRFFVMSAFNRDYTMILGTVLFYAALIILFNTMVDIVLAWIDPRVRGSK